MKLCNTCGQPVTRGHCGSDYTGSTICLVCRTERLMRGWRYPATQTKQRELRERMGQTCASDGSTTTQKSQQLTK